LALQLVRVVLVVVVVVVVVEVEVVVVVVGLVVAAARETDCRGLPGTVPEWNKMSRVPARSIPDNETSRN